MIVGSSILTFSCSLCQLQFTIRFIVRVLAISLCFFSFFVSFIPLCHLHLNHNFIHIFFILEFFLARRWFHQSDTEHKLVMVGLDNAGKTTILYQFLMNEVVHTSPTIGSNVEEIVWKNIHFLVWDLAGKQWLSHPFPIVLVFMWSVGISIRSC